MGSLRPPENTSHSEGVVNFKSEGGPPPPSVVNFLSKFLFVLSDVNLTQIMTSAHAAPFVSGSSLAALPSAASEHGSLNLHSDLAPRFIVGKKV